MAVDETDALRINRKYIEFEGFLTYLQNIDWKDPCLIALLTFHVFVISAMILTRNHGNFQVVLFLLLLILVYFSESLNDIASNSLRNPYFDSSGVFISVTFSTPILLNCMVLVASWLYQSGQLMSQIKRAQLQRKARLGSSDLNDLSRKKVK